MYNVISTYPIKKKSITEKLVIKTKNIFKKLQ